jgi:uncharacterized YigZ family protein
MEPLDGKDTYLTIESPTEAIFKEKKSKFLAFSYPVESEAAIKEHLQNLRKQYFDARHHCYAYVWGESQENVRANDDGEPSHSAGDPILGQIRARQLTNVLVVVVRYFGGVKLGVGGLVQAYKTAASDALDQATVVERIMTVPLNLRFEYVRLNEVMKVVKDFDLEVTEQQFDNLCQMRVKVRKKWAGAVREKLKEVLETDV